MGDFITHAICTNGIFSEISDNQTKVNTHLEFFIRKIFHGLPLRFMLGNFKL